MTRQDQQPFRRGTGEPAKQTDRKPEGQTKVPKGKTGAGKAEEQKSKNKKAVKKAKAKES